MKTKIKKTLLLMMSLMLMASVVFTGCGETEEKEEKKDKKDKKEKEEEADETVVSSVEDLLDAIEPGVTIRIEDGNYNLTEYIEDVDIDDFNDDHKYVYFRECYDGYELVISGVDDLTIYSDIEDEVEIQVEPRYAVVLNFDACTNIYLKHLIVGHTEEEAYCTGAVLNFSSCENISLNGMDLYGCGTYGIEGDYTDGIYVSDSVIRDCSYGLMYLQCCTSLDFESCSMYGCDGYNMIDVYSTQGEFNDCSFYDNTFDQSWNTFIALSSDNDLVFNSCYFGQQESISIYKELLDQPTLTFNDCTFEEVTGSSAIPVTPVDVQVSSVEELLDEIAPYTFITVEAGQYNLTDYIDSIDIDDFNDTHEYVQITEVYDGYAVEIYDADYLYIVGESEDPADVEIVTEPRYADVFAFCNCDSLGLGLMTLGHTDTGECAGSVIRLTGCFDAYMSNLDLYGCGVYGIDMCDGTLAVDDTVIRDCSYGPGYIMDIDGDVNFTNCEFYGSDGGFVIYPSEYDVVFQNCSFGERESSSILYSFSATLYDCTFEEFDDSMYEYYGDLYDDSDLEETYIGDVDYTGFWYAYRVTDGGGDEQSIPYADPETFERSFLFVCFFDDGTGFIRGLYGEEDKLYFTYSQNNNGNFIDISSDGYSLFDDAEGYVYIDSQDILLMDLTVDDDITFRLEQLIYY